MIYSKLISVKVCIRFKLSWQISPRLLAECPEHKISKMKRAFSSLAHCKNSQQVFTDHITAMKLPSTIIVLMALFSFASAASKYITVRVGFNYTLDSSDTLLSTVTCFDALKSKGYNTTFDSLPSFPNIGSYSAVKNSHSTKCGSCWELTYDPSKPSTYIYVIDTAEDDFQVSQESMASVANEDTRPGQYLDSVLATEVDESYCQMVRDRLVLSGSLTP